LRRSLAGTIAELERERAGLEASVAARTAELTRALAELRETQAALLHGEKMSSLGQLVAGIAHELNNPLTAIGGSAPPLAELAASVRRMAEEYRAVEHELPEPTRRRIEQLRRDADLDATLDDLEGIAGVVGRAGERARRIVDNLLRFSRASKDPVPTDVREGLAETLALLEPQLRRAGVALERRFDQVAGVLARADELNQVFANLVGNALHALEGQPIRRLRVEVRAAGEAVEVVVEDSGPGVPPELRARVFDPFFTTKPAGKGTGLGLSISAQIVARHRGTLRVEGGEPGDGDRLGGARFVMRLPALPERAARSA
jgi:signal transduction histidine kinase